MTMTQKVEKYLDDNHIGTFSKESPQEISEKLDVTYSVTYAVFRKRQMTFKKIGHDTAKFRKWVSENEINNHLDYTVAEIMALGFDLEEKKIRGYLGVNRISYNRKRKAKTIYLEELLLSLADDEFHINMNIKDIRTFIDFDEEIINFDIQKVCRNNGITYNKIDTLKEVLLEIKYEEIECAKQVHENLGKEIGMYFRKAIAEDLMYKENGVYHLTSKGEERADMKLVNCKTNDDEEEYWSL